MNTMSNRILFCLLFICLVFAGHIEAASNTGTVERIATEEKSADSIQKESESSPVPSIDNSTKSEASSAQAPADEPVLSYDMRFSKPLLVSDTATFPLWEAADCGCVPNSPLESYGFFPLATQEKPAKINFEAVSRIEYYSLTPDAVGNIEIPEAWDAKAFTMVAHRYAVKVDLVVSKDAWCSETSKTSCINDALELDKSYVLQNLVVEIVDALKAMDADGVTIDFAKLPAELKDPYLFFIKRLSKRLEQEGEDYRLNVVLPDSTELKKLFSEATILEGLRNSKDYVDSFLIGWTGNQNLPDTVNVLDNAFWKSEIDARKAIIVLDADDKNFEEKYKLIVKRNFGGAAIWSITAEKSDWETVVSAGREQAAQAGDMDIIKGLFQQAIPAEVCKLICPNREVISLVLSVLAGIYLLCIFLSLFLYELRDIIKKYILYFLAAGAVLVLVFFFSVLCVPFWRSYETEITSSLVILAAAYFIKSMLDKKREKDYP